jgi:hypothetical protein
MPLTHVRMAHTLPTSRKWPITLSGAWSSLSDKEVEAPPYELKLVAEK